MRLPWECHDQSQETNWRHCIAFLSLKRKGTLKIDQCVKMPWYTLSIGVVCAYSSAPGTPIIDQTFSRVGLNIREHKPNIGWRSACTSWLAAFVFKFVLCITLIYLKFTCNGICVIKMMINQSVKQWFKIIWRLEESKRNGRLSLTRMYLKRYVIGLDLKTQEQNT